MSKKIKNIIRHGELILKGVDGIPDGAKLIETTNRKIVAWSETHHHHVLESKESYQIYSWNGETYIHLGNIATLFHEKTGKDVHTPHELKPATYKVIIKKEFDYYEGIMKQVRD
jgi:hypothetical protein